MSTRRKFLAGTAGAAAGALIVPQVEAEAAATKPCGTETVSLCGEWQFRIDPNNLGTKESWEAASCRSDGWRAVNVPHTWQVEAPLAEYRGSAWYQRAFDVPARWRGCAVRVEFEAVFHTATVWVNGQLIGEHARKGYTAFALDIAHVLHEGPNSIAVRVDNAFNRHMLPRGASSDWANDGGIFRPVQLLITPKAFVERVDVDAAPDLPSGDGKVTINAYVRNAGTAPWTGVTGFQIFDGQTSAKVVEQSTKNSVTAGAVEKFAFAASLPNAKLWHFDNPNLYRLEFSISGEHDAHRLATNFGVRKLEVKDGAFYLNGERVRLMGVERMAGSNPEFGMAEPTEWITHDHADMKHLNCVFTRVHWPQDRRVLDYCDRHGILMQTEVPAWGWETFEGMTAQPESDIIENGLEQLREMIARDRNHPSIVVWGLCNEIAGQNPPAYQFAKRMLEEAKRLDPNRLCSYASNSLDRTPERDVAALMDFVETNEYYGSWAPGTAEDVSRQLDELHAAFPGKPIVISEYGYCACTPDRPEGDQRRMEIMRSHDVAIRSKEFVSGAIFFCYNDYRTHVGDRGVGPLKQRIHGVVDLYGEPKPSYELLRRESSPIESLTVEHQVNKFRVLIKTRRDLPMYALRGYKLRGLLFGPGNVPVERQELELPEIEPGSNFNLELSFTQVDTPTHIQFDVLRPTSFSAYSLYWKPYVK
jgi:beta-glucuronidase